MLWVKKVNIKKPGIPGIFRYVGKNVTVYGISYRDASGKKHLEIVGPQLGKAQAKLHERREQKKRGIVVQRKVTFRELA